MSHVPHSTNRTGVKLFKPISTTKLLNHPLFVVLIPQQSLLSSATTLLSNVYSTLSTNFKIIIVLIYLLLDTFNLGYSPGHHLTIYLHPLNLILHFQYKRNSGYKLRYLSYPSSPPTIDLHLVDFQIIHPI